MGVSYQFEQAIKNYLDSFAVTNEYFANKYRYAAKKSIEKCCEFIIQEVQKMKVNGLSDDEVFYLARHYYEEDNLTVDPMASKSVKVVVNHQVELTEEEKKQAKEAAFEEYKASERKRIENEEKKRLENEKKALEKARQKEISEKNGEQISLFDLIGGD